MLIPNIFTRRIEIRNSIRLANNVLGFIACLLATLFIATSSVSAETSENTQNIEAYCAQLTPAQRNTMEAVYDNDCVNGFYKLMYGVDRLELSLKKGIDYDLTPLCEFNDPFQSLSIVGLHNEFPNCFSHSNKLIALSVYTGTDFDLSSVTNIKSLMILTISQIENVYGVLNAKQLESLTIKSSRLDETVKLVPQTSLDTLRLSNVNLENLDMFREFTNIRRLVISSLHDVENLNAIADYPKLEYLRIHNIKHDYEFPLLKNNPALEFISVRKSHFDGLDKLKYLTGLKELVVEETVPSITDISPIQNIATLEKVNFKRQDISDITPLAKLPNLKTADLSVGNDYMNDLTLYFEIAQRKSPVWYYDRNILSCSPETYEEYQKGKRCTEQKRRECGKMKPGILRKLCVLWN